MELLRWRFCLDIAIRVLLRFAENVCCLDSGCEEAEDEGHERELSHEADLFRIV
jgi:hypothetical protein